MELVPIRTFVTRIDAELAKGALHAAGIESMISADDSGGTRPHLWASLGVRLLVREADLEEAESVLSVTPHTAD
jgi:hypothetical protein